MKRPSSIENRIREVYDQLPVSERKLADVILDAPGSVATFSATELAEKADVSKAAASRLFKRLGFQSFGEARLLARDTRNWGAPLYLRTDGISRFDERMSEFVKEDVGMLQQTFSALDNRDLKNICTALATAERVWMIGFRYNHVIAAYGHWQFMQIRPNIFLYPGPGQTLGELVAQAGASDVVVVSGLRRRTSNLNGLLESLSGTGARILYLTDRTARRSPRHATWTVPCEINGGFMFDSYTAPMAVMRYLSLITMDILGKQARVHMEKIERQHDLMSELA